MPYVCAGHCRTFGKMSSGTGAIPTATEKNRRLFEFYSEIEMTEGNPIGVQLIKVIIVH